MPYILMKQQEGRRTFIKQLALAGFAVQFGSILSCTSDGAWPKAPELTNLTPQDIYVIAKIQSILFPSDGNGPDCDELHSMQHVIWTLSIEKDLEEKYKSDLEAFQLMWKEHLNIDYRDADEQTWKSFVSIASQHSNTKIWISWNLNLILESLSLDPIYGVNSNESGWKWLEHQPGYPRPNNDTKFK